MQQNTEEYKGNGPVKQSIIEGTSAYCVSSLAAVAAMHVLPKNIYLQGALSLAALGTAAIGAIHGHGMATEAKQQFEQNQQTIAEQGNIIAQAEHQGLIQTKTVVERGPAA